MSNKINELDKIRKLRLSNEESNRITRESIQTAFIQLLKYKELPEITISEIVKKAGTSRTAYYRNYSCKEDILYSLMQEVSNDIVKSFNHRMLKENSYEAWLFVLNSIKPFADEFRILMKANFGEAIMLEIKCALQNNSHQNDIRSAYIAAYWSGILFSVLSQWIINDFCSSTETVASICCSIL